MPEKLTLADYARAASALACDLAAIKAVVEVESGPLGGFDRRTGKPIILFEPHVFSRLTGRRYDETHPAISYKKWKTLPYPKTQGERWQQLDEARALDTDAADSAASWGLFQIMGFNYAACGFSSVAIFVAAMHLGEADHLDAFVAFVTDAGLDVALRRHDWPTFARGYNGPGQVGYYATKMSAAWKRHGGGQ